MYVISFYSFKGGVGRTMAVANIGVWLASKGRRVLMVDFDLEAPGLTSFDLPQPVEPSRGVVDYLASYIETGVAPKLEGHYYQVAGVGKNGGELFVMPAGLLSGYQDRFHTIDFKDLYANRDGFLLMENLKSQFEQQIAPDYVLIDSRTGHTDIAGICTRQLPDSVAFVFYPSRQNIQGLADIVNDVRAQNREQWRKPIRCHFIASNLPISGDQSEIVDTAIANAKKLLEFDELDGRINYYPSAAHIQQTVVTHEWPNSEMAEQYGRLASRLMEENVSDPDAVIRKLEGYLNRRRPWSGTQSAGSLDEYLDSVERSHGSNAEVLFMVARVRLRQGLIDEALLVLDAAVQVAGSWSEPVLLRGHLLAQRGKREAAIADAKAVLNSKTSDFFQVSQASVLLRDLDSAGLKELSEFRAFAQLDVDARLAVLHDLTRAVGVIGCVDSVIEHLLATETLTETQREQLVREMSCILIRRRDFKRAMDVLGARPKDDSKVTTVFNYAVAEWGKNGRPPIDLFTIVSKRLDSMESVRRDANHAQCHGLSLAVVGDNERAISVLESARRLGYRSPRLPFSCWTYEYVERTSFDEQITEMIAAIEHGSFIPPAVRSG